MKGGLDDNEYAVYSFICVLVKFELISLTDKKKLVDFMWSESWTPQSAL